ncbi:MAG: adenosylcobalamin-dependent ribonucleoside-diphosphate reductase [Bacteroidales bacterium]|nr:adenosylcobalamin-dependent ribonucleoside-diphosphate reductase [Bacteroidales bacterium]
MEQKKTYKMDDAQKASEEYFGGDALAARVWLAKYALKDSDGNLYERTPDDMHHRIAAELARIDKNYANPVDEKVFFDLLKDFKYIVPQGGPMSGIGNTKQIVSLSNCFVIGNESLTDSYGGVMRIDEEQVQLMKRRGGVGHDLSHLRPAGSPVKNSALTSTGIVPFMERYSNTTREVAQDGRRGALMLSVSIKHPDSEDFIDAKLIAGKVTGANISVKITDDFMKAVIEHRDFVQQYPVDSDNPMIVKTVNPENIWKKIVHNAWSSAEPGILFWDTIIRESIPDCYADLGYRTVSTNPCGEIPLCPYDSCRLLALNLYSYVDNPFTPKAKFNFKKFKEHVHFAARMMDDIIDLELEKIDSILAKIDSDPEDEEIKHVERHLWEKIYDKAVRGRRMGIGITAEGDMLAALNMRYSSDEANAFAVEVQKTLAVEAYRASVMMAKERGAFPIFDANREKDNPFINRIKEADPEVYEQMLKYGRRNIAMLTIAPTGTTSIMTQTTSGIEPVFKVYYKRRRKINPNDPDSRVDYVDPDTGEKFEEYIVYHHKFVDWLKVNGYNVDEVMRLPEAEIEKIVAKSPYDKATANDIDYINKVRMQGAIQKWVDHSISVTINMPNNISADVVAECYMEAWKSGCKGVTVYRDGSRSGVLVDAKKGDGKTEKPATVHERPKVLDADIVRFSNQKENWIAFIGLVNGSPYEIFTGRVEDDVLNIPKSITHGYIVKVPLQDGTTRYDFQYKNKYGYVTTFEGLSHIFDSEYWNYAKLISGVLRHGMEIDKVVKLVTSLQLSDNINTWKAGVARALKRYIPDGTSVDNSQACPHCGQKGTLVYQDGCVKCTSCGYSKCG